jgi:hypothetical protein
LRSAAWYSTVPRAARSDSARRRASVVAVSASRSVRSR